MANYVKALVSEKDVRRWLVADDQVPHVVFFTDKKSTPPLLKTLSIEFKGRAALGVVLLGSEDLAQKMGAERRPALVYVQDEASLSGETFDREFKKVPPDEVHQPCSADSGPATRRLTAAREAAGECAVSDGHVGCPAEDESLVGVELEVPAVDAEMADAAVAWESPIHHEEPERL
ncbi:C2H2-type domain-containing protein [Durusdinium trenchii]|uniref:C2H2-type domain-containing protein n=1 Tax=Durusdinium trenchii TaxID=1381693 RepID=A0ABP0P5V9_9DINO